MTFNKSYLSKAAICTKPVELNLILFLCILTIEGLVLILLNILK